MTRNTAFSMLLVILVAAGCSKSGARDDGLAPLQGNWTVVELNENGKSFSADELQKMLVSFERDRFTRAMVKTGNTQSGGAATSVGGGGGSNTSMNNIVQVVDPAKEPGEIDFVVPDGPDQGKARKGIYELSGDNLKICAAALGAERPTTFAASEKTSLMVLTRKK